MVLAKTRSTTMVRSRGGGRISLQGYCAGSWGTTLLACMHSCLPVACTYSDICLARCPPLTHLLAAHMPAHLLSVHPLHSPTRTRAASPQPHTPTRSPAPWQHAAAILFAALLLPASSQAQSCREQGCSDSWSVRIDAALARAAIEYNRATVLLTLSEGRQEGAFDADIAANTAPLQLAREGVCRVLGCSG